MPLCALWYSPELWAEYVIAACISHQGAVMLRNYLLPDRIKECFLLCSDSTKISKKNFLGNIKISDFRVLPSEIDAVILERPQS